MRVGILGSGLMGAKLGTLFARAGHEVTFSYARSKEKLSRLAREAGAKARAGTPREAAEGADALLLAVHWSRIDDVLSQAGLVWQGLVSCSLPLNAQYRTHPRPHYLGAEALPRKFPVPRSSPRSTTFPRSLFGVFKARGSATRPSMVYCGDNQTAKTLAATLIRDVGFEPIDAGPLRIARYTEPFALLVAELAYGGQAGPELAYRFERFGT